MRLTLNGTSIDVDAATLGDLVGPLPEGHAVAINDEVVPGWRHGTRLLRDGDVVEIVRAVAGG